MAVLPLFESFEDETDDYDETDDPLADEDRRSGRGRGKKRGEKKTGVQLTETLRPLRGEVKRMRFSVVDIEAYKWVHPYMVGWWDGTGAPKIWESRHWTKGGRTRKKPSARQLRKLKRRPPVGPDCLEQFIEWYLRPETLGTVCFAHNGGNYDFIFFLRKLLKGERFTNAGYTVKLTPIQSNLFRIEVTHPDHKGRWLFVDSTRLLPMRLDQVGETFKVGRKVELHKVLGCSVERVYDELAKPAHAATARKYLAQDCRVLFRGLERFQEIVNRLGGQMKLTAPSTSLDVFRRSFHKRDIFLNRHFATCPDLGKDKVTCLGCGHRYIRSAYFGGRCEIFNGLGGTFARPLHYYDVNSHYPDCMREPMPVGVAQVVEVGGTPAQVEKAAATGMIGIIDCDVEIPEDCYLPPLPVRVGGKLVFPVGKFRGTWDTAELALLPEVGGRVVKVYRQAWFEAAPVFAGFVAALWKYRDKTSPTWDAGLDATAKLMANSNYGKWGQREEQTEVFIGPTREMIFSRQLRDLDLGLDIWEGAAQHKPEHVCPQLAVHVTALARARLWRHMKRALDEGCRIFYCDTDSLIVEFPEGAKPWPSSKKLGELKLEHVIGRAQFVLPKAYYLECAKGCPCEVEAKSNPNWHREKVKAKGMGAGLGVKLDVTDWIRLTNPCIQPSARKVVRQRFAKWRESISQFYKHHLEFPRVQRQAKGFGSEYDKREVCADGVATRPLLLDGGSVKLRETRKVFEGLSRDLAG